MTTRARIADARAMYCVAASVLSALVFTAIGPVRAFAVDALQPALSLPATPVVPGQTITISGTGFPAQTPLRMELCGRNAVDGDVDCDFGSSVPVWSPDTTFINVLTINPPPRPCPCVIRLRGTGTDFLFTTPIAIDGVPVVEPVGPDPTLGNPNAGLSVVSASIRDDDTFWTVFGESARRVLVLTVRNDSTSAIEAPAMSAAWGRGGSHDHPITTPINVVPIQPGETRVIDLPFRLHALSWGDYQAVGTIGAGQVAFSAKTTVIPWGLIILAILLVQLVLLVMRNIARRHLVVEGDEDEPCDDMSPEPDDDPDGSEGAEVMEPSLI